MLALIAVYLGALRHISEDLPEEAIVREGQRKTETYQ